MGIFETIPICVSHFPLPHYLENGIECNRYGSIDGKTYAANLLILWFCVSRQQEPCNGKYDCKGAKEEQIEIEINVPQRSGCATEAQRANGAGQDVQVDCCWNR